MADGRVHYVSFSDFVRETVYIQPMYLYVLGLGKTTSFSITCLRNEFSFAVRVVCIGYVSESI